MASPEGSVVGILAGSGTVSPGLETDASEVSFPVISELVVGRGVKLECLRVSCRSGPPGCLGNLGLGLYRQGLPHPQQTIPSCGVRSGRGGRGAGSTQARNSSGEELQGPLEENTTSTSPELDLTARVPVPRVGRA